MPKGKAITIMKAGGGASIEVEVFPGDDAAHVCTSIAPHLGEPADGRYQLFGLKGNSIGGDIYEAVESGDRLSVAIMSIVCGAEADFGLEKEIAHLQRLKRILEDDLILPLRFDLQCITPTDWHRFHIPIRGIRSLIADPIETSDCVRANFTVAVEVPQEYPWAAIPHIKFLPPIPFHPHVYHTGAIAWFVRGPMPNLWLADWFCGVVDCLQWNQDTESVMKIDPSSPASSVALKWWQQNGRRLYEYVPPIDMGRLRSWVNRLRG